MSYRTFSINGYGAKIKSLEITKEGMENLLKDVSPTLRGTIEEITNGLSDFDTDTLNDYGWGGIASILVEVIKEVEGNLFDACEDFDGVKYVLLCPTYPWSTFEDIEKYKEMTPEKVTEILTKYITALDEGADFDIDYQECENGG